MNHKIFLRPYSLLAALAGSMLTLAAHTTETAEPTHTLTSDEALARVVAHWNSQAPVTHRAPVSPQAFSLAKVGNAPSQATPAYYVFNRTSGGFVIAPADEAQPALLAVIDEGAYDEANLPNGFKAWLQEVITYGAANNQASTANNQASTATVPVASAAGAAPPAAAPLPAAVAPLLADDQISWTQTAPYNTDCPKFNYNDYNYDTLAGCAAIAVGQIMRFHKFPDRGYGSVKYSSYVTVQNETIETPVNRDFSTHTYDWAKIRGNYQFSGTGTNDERAEVAKFVADVACASKMNFDPQASATYDYCVAQALKNNFDYDPSLQLIDHANFSTGEWADVLRAELNAGRPVYLSGANISAVNGRQFTSGHAFVCDGYNADGLFHINWGWGGTSDGYFALTSLNPKQQGAGGSAGGYSFMANAIIGIQPYCGGEESKAVLTLDNEYWETSYDNANDGYVIHANIANLTATDFEGFVAMRFMEGDKVLLGAKQNAKALRALASTGGQYSLGLDRTSLIEHPTVRMELVYVHRAGVMAASAAERTAMLEAVGDDEWISISSREGAPKSLQAYKDSKDQFSFGSVPDEVYQLRLAGLQADVTPKPGARVKFTATVTNLSDYEYFAPLYLSYYDRNGARIDDYSEYDLHLLPAHSTKNFDFTVTIPSNAASYTVLYEDLGYFWSYVPMQVYESDAYSVTGPFAPLLEPDPSEEGPDQPGIDPDKPGYTPAEGALAYYVKNVDSGYYLNVVESERSCAVLREEKEVLYFEPTSKAGEYTIKGHTGLYLGGYEDNVWNMSSACPETWIVEKQADGSVAFHAKSNATTVNGYIGFDTANFQYYALGAAAKRNQSYATAHGLFLLEEVKTLPDGPDSPDQPAFDGTIAAVGDPVPEGSGSGGADLSNFPEEGVGYYIKNIDSQLYLNVVADKNKAVLLSDSPEKFYFKPAPNSYTGETGFYIYTADDNNHFLGGHWSNSFNTNNTVEMVWYVREVSDGVYAFLDLEHVGMWDVSSSISATQEAFLGFNDVDYTVTPTRNFSTSPLGFPAMRNKKLSEHALFSIELEGAGSSASGPIYGDVDQNRTLEAADVTALANILLRKKEVTPEADTDLNRFITISDIVKLIKYLRK